MRDATFEGARNLLQLDADYSKERLKAAYRHAVRLVPPDRDPDRFERVRAAYDLLRSPLEGRNTWLLARHPHCPPPLAGSATEFEGERRTASALARAALRVFVQSQELESLLPDASLDQPDSEPRGSAGGTPTALEPEHGR
jgi:hypothetical protein